MFPSDIDLNDLTAAVSTTDANSSTSAATTGVTTLGRSPYFDYKKKEFVINSGFNRECTLTESIEQHIRLFQLHKHRTMRMLCINRQDLIDGCRCRIRRYRQKLFTQQCIGKRRLARTERAKKRHDKTASPQTSCLCRKLRCQLFKTRQSVEDICTVLQPVRPAQKLLLRDLCR